MSQAAGDDRYVVVNRWTREVVDNGNGYGYRSALAAHKSFSFKQQQRSGNGRGGQQGSWRSGYRRADQTGTGSGQPYAGRQQRSEGYGQRRGLPPSDVSPFVQEAGVPCGVHAYRSTPDGRGRATNRYQLQQQRQQDVSQENTPPPPDLFAEK